MDIQIGGVFGFIVLVVNVFALLSVVQSSETTGTKVFWVILILILPILGTLLWFLVGPKNNTAHI